MPRKKTSVTLSEEAIELIKNNKLNLSSFLEEAILEKLAGKKIVQEIKEKNNYPKYVETIFNYADIFYKTTPSSLILNYYYDYRCNKLDRLLKENEEQINKIQKNPSSNLSFPELLKTLTTLYHPTENLYFFKDLCEAYTFITYVSHHKIPYASAPLHMLFKFFPIFEQGYEVAVLLGPGTFTFSKESQIYLGPAFSDLNFSGDALC